MAKKIGNAININVPLILKMRDIIFCLRANYRVHYGPFQGHFEGSKKSRPPRNIPWNGPLCSLPKTKIIQNMKLHNVFRESGTGYSTVTNRRHIIFSLRIRIREAQNNADPVHKHWQKGRIISTVPVPGDAGWEAKSINVAPHTDPSRVYGSSRVNITLIITEKLWRPSIKTLPTLQIKFSLTKLFTKNFWGSFVPDTEPFVRETNTVLRADPAFRNYKCLSDNCFYHKVQIVAVSKDH